MDVGNPYISPETDLTGPPEVNRKTERSGVGLYLAWVAVFFSNMIVPTFWGYSMIKELGGVGLCLAAISLLNLGLWSCAISRKVGGSLVVGGVVIGLSQFAPALQIIAGWAGLSARKAFMRADETPTDITNVSGGFVITFVTGGILMAMSLAIGLILRGILSFWDTRAPQSA